MFNQQYAEHVAARLAELQRIIDEEPPPPPRFSMDSSEGSDEEDEEKRTLFCANLDERVTEELLYEVFLQGGPVESVRIPKDSGGRQRTFGFITYAHACSAPYAMQLFQGLALFHKTLTIKFKGSNQLPVTPPQPKRHSLPNDCDINMGNSMRRNFDNSSLRGSAYPAYYDPGMNDAMSPGFSRVNPFQREAGPFVSIEPDDRAAGSSGSVRREKERNVSLHRERAQPYQRRSGGSEDRPYDRGVRDRGIEHQRRPYHHHNGSNRRSEQRSGHRR